MVDISLTNTNPQSPDKKVIINIKSGICRFADGRESSLKNLIGNSEFHHPLLNEASIAPVNGLYHYEYNTIEELLYCGIFVYAQLIHSASPLYCSFKINPSSVFKPCQTAAKVFFSINQHKEAQESLAIQPFEALISDFMGFKFTFSESVIIENLFTIEDLPDTVDGDFLYQINHQLIALLKKPIDSNQYELRYINPTMGLGVFAKQPLKKGDVAAVYTGVKRMYKPPIGHFAFRPQDDCLQMFLDASYHGNIARFINHAPPQDNTLPGDLVSANLSADSDYTNGIEIIVYKATHDIGQGEQLLVDYGEDYFEEMPMIRFKSTGQLLSPKLSFKRRTSRLRHLRLMANHGVRTAQFYLHKRMLTIIMIIFIGMCLAGLVDIGY